MKKIVSLKKTTLDAIRDSINDTNWDFLHELKKYKYDVITNAMPKVFGSKTLKRFKGKYNDYDFSYATIANLLDAAEKEKLLKYLKSNGLQKDSKAKDSEYVGNARIVNKLPKVGDKDKDRVTPCSVISVKKIKTEKGYSIYKVTYQYDDTIGLGKIGEDVDTYYFTYAVKDGIHDDREEYCVMKNGNNIECFGSKEEAIPFAKKNKAGKVLRVKYGNRNANGDEDELESESVWEEDSISGETWIDTPELLEEDDFKDSDLREYWVINLDDINDEDIKLEVRIQTAEMMLGYLDDFKNRNVREEVENDLRDFIKKNKTQKVHPKGSFKKIGEGKYTRREAEEPFTDSNPKWNIWVKTKDRGWRIWGGTNVEAKAVGEDLLDEFNNRGYLAYSIVENGDNYDAGKIIKLK